MGFFSGLARAAGNFISGVGRTICGCVGSLCSAIAGTALGGALGGAVQKIVGVLGVVFPPLKIIETIILVATLVSKIAEALGLKEKEKDEPDKLAMKAEKADKKPEDFDSTEAYIKYLQEEVQLTDEEKEKLKNMDEEKRAAYRATGTYLYTKEINEKLGFDKTGMKNSELIGITSEILTDLVKLDKILSPSDFVVYAKHLQSAGLSMNDFSNYLHNSSESVRIDKKVQNALVEGMKEIDPNISDDDIDQKLVDLTIEG